MLLKKGNAINAHCKTYRYVYSMNHELNGKNGNVIIYNLRIDRYAENMIETENISYQMFLIKTREIVILARVFFAPKFN